MKRGDGFEFIATRAAFELLGHIVSGLLEEADCKFSLEPFGAGSAYFQGTGNRGAGLYLHRQPCCFESAIFPEGRGIGWLCFAGSFEDVPATERDYDPSFVAVEGETTALTWLKETFLRVAVEGSSIVISADELGKVFGSLPAFGLEIIAVDGDKATSLDSTLCP